MAQFRACNFVCLLRTIATVSTYHCKTGMNAPPFFLIPLQWTQSQVFSKMSGQLCVNSNFCFFTAHKRKLISSKSKSGQKFGLSHTKKRTCFCFKFLLLQFFFKLFFIRFGIQVAGFSTDGDFRCLTSMKHSLKSLIDSENPDVLQDIKNEQYLSVVQDPTHHGGKMRNRKLKPSIVMPMGRKQVSVGHLKILIDSVSKDVHGLVRSDILPDDKQNFRSFEKISEPRVLNALKQHVLDSEATIMYLQISRQMTSAYMEPNISPLERIFRMWHALYFLRAWRTWILAQKPCDGLPQLSLDKNFISDNAFACAELNAYSLIHLLTKFRDANTPEFFLPTLFQSQACEQTFRQMRSMTTINWTKINFTLLELIQIVDRIELQNNIAYFELADKNVSFPRIQNRSKNLTTYPLPSDEQIRQTLREAQNIAVADALKFGMVVNISDILQCKLRKGQVRQNVQNKDQNLICNENNLSHDDLVFSNLKDYSEKACHIDDRFVQVFDEVGSTKTVLKSSLVWVLTETKGVLSNDRLRRVQGQSGISTKRKNITRKDIEISPQVASKRSKHLIGVRVDEEIKVGNWCIFKWNANTPESCNADTNVQKNIVHGAVLAFKYIVGKTEKEKQYTMDFASVLNDVKIDGREIEALATWYKYGENNALEPFSENNNFFINITNYIATVDAPSVNNDQILYENHDEISKFVASIFIN